MLSDTIPGNVAHTSLPDKTQPTASFYASTGPMKGVFEPIAACSNALTSFWPLHHTTVSTLLNSLSVKWTTVDILRVVDPDGVSHQVMIIGLEPDALLQLSHSGALAAVEACKELLCKHGVHDLECSIEELTSTLNARHPLQVVGNRKIETPGEGPTSQIPFSSTLGVAVSPSRNPTLDSTRGFFLVPILNPDKKVYFVLCRHSLGLESIGQSLISIIQPPDSHMAERPKAVIEKIKDSNDFLAQILKIHEGGPRAKDMTEDISTMSNSIGVLGDELSVLQACKEEKDRAIGVVEFAPDISVGAPPENFTFDICVCEADSSKFNSKNFRENVVDFGDAK